MKKLSRTICFFVLFGSAALLPSCSGETGKSGDQATRASRAALVTYVEATVQDVPRVLSAIGTVEPSATVNIVSRISGELLEIHIDEGEYVTEGQLLFTIDKRPLEIALGQAKAQLESDRARLAKAEQDLGRSQELTRGGFTSASQHDEARVVVASLRALVTVDEATVESAMLSLSYADIRSPMSGRAGAIKVDKGNMVAALQQPLVTINAHQPVNVTFFVPERHILSVRGMAPGANLLVIAQSKGGEACQGGLTFIGDVDKSTGTMQLKAMFPNENSLMWPGEFFHIRLQLAVLKDSVTVPSRAVVIGPEGTFVYVVTDEMKAEYRLVETSVEENGVIVITKGLQAGEKVVMEGHVRLSDGITVRFLEENEAQSTNYYQRRSGTAS